VRSVRDDLGSELHRADDERGPRAGGGLAEVDADHVAGEAELPPPTSFGDVNGVLHQGEERLAVQVRDGKQVSYRHTEPVGT
jgi:hypothetical protein